MERAHQETFSKRTEMKKSTHHHHGTVPSRKHNVCGDRNRQSRFVEMILGGVLVLAFRQLRNLKLVVYPGNDVPFVGSLDIHTDTVTGNSILKSKNNTSQSYRKLKPWQSKPPIPVALMTSNHNHSLHGADNFIVQRHTCIQSIRDRQHEIFQYHFFQDDGYNETTTEKKENLEIVLVDPSYHANVGDHMLTIAELTLIQTSLNLSKPQQCHYYQASSFYPPCDTVLKELNNGGNHRLALWHAGGNWGDLWNRTQGVRIPSMQTILEGRFKLISLPQSLFYKDQKKEENEVTAIKKHVALGLGLATIRVGGKSKQKEQIDISALHSNLGREMTQSMVTLMWRERESYERAVDLYPFATNVVVPDMAFQLGPYSPIRETEEQHPAAHDEERVDILLFLRTDKESKLRSQRNEESIQKIMPSSDLTFKIVDWADRLKIFNTTDPFFTDSAIRLLSLGKVVVCDRLHAAILSYLSGIPFVYIDQISGKISKTLSTAFEHSDVCKDRKGSRWDRGSSLEEALLKAIELMNA